MRRRAMGRLHVEVAKYQLNKHGEELCGDSVEVETCPDSTIVVLSDGLGSGVKANILSSLTTKMAVTMLKGGLKLDEVVEAFVHTLPVCERRQLAYSTFSILQIFSDGNVYLAEYDSPPAFIGRGSRLRSVRRSERIIDERKISEAFFSVEDGDWIVLTSDGVLHAGIGGIWNIGWGWDKVGDYISSAAVRTKLASELAEEIAEVTSKLYAFKPGDDATVVAIRVRYPRHLTMLVGPPVNTIQSPSSTEKKASLIFLSSIIRSDLRTLRSRLPRPMNAGGLSYSARYTFPSLKICSMLKVE
jgi:hypothetical protein